jgi:hypothetical protein
MDDDQACASILECTAQSVERVRGGDIEFAGGRDVEQHRARDLVCGIDGSEHAVGDGSRVEVVRRRVQPHDQQAIDRSLLGSAVHVHEAPAGALQTPECGHGRLARVVEEDGDRQGRRLRT